MTPIPIIAVDTGTRVRHSRWRVTVLEGPACTHAFNLHHLPEWSELRRGRWYRVFARG